MDITDPVILGKIGQIVLADILLAGDNALVIALATRGLPATQQFWGRMLGAGGAVVLRVIFILIIGMMLKIPYIQLIGGLLLIWIAAKLVRPEEDAMEAAGSDAHKTPRSLRDAVTMIIVADITMSLDNVVAIANIAKDRATGEMQTPLVVFGLLLSIPLVVWGSTLITKLMVRYRWIVWLGGGVLGHVAASIIFHDHRVLGWMGFDVPASGQHIDFQTLLATAPSAIAMTIRCVPWILAVALFAYGWWWSRVGKVAKSQ